MRREAKPRAIGAMMGLLGVWMLGAAWAASSMAAEPTTSIDALRRQFANPAAEYRGKPFWSWNGELRENELRRQMDVLQGMGMGGFFMHSRTGLATEYLGDEWFRLINACADEAKRRGMEAWLYDEDRWPSGTAGGRVTENPKFRLKFVGLSTVPAAQFRWSDDLVAAFAVDLDGNAFRNCVRLAKSTAPESYAGKTVLTFAVEEMGKSSFYNGFTYADTLNREATDYFIKLTYDAYAARCGDRIGTTIRGIFTDEPHRGSLMTDFGIDNPNRVRMAPWTYDVPEQFRKRFGYDLVERLPELFLRKDGRAVAQVKWHYVELLQSMFLENWAKPIHRWCREHGMIFTGHVLHEDTLASQVAMQGSLMRFYECMDWPGVDLLTEGNRNYWIAKQAASVARQLDQKWILSELYGCTGWQFNFESHKWVGDWQALFGVNLRCQHLAWYTMAGEAKRDYPASIFYQSAWWKDYPTVEDYFSRLHVMLGQGKPACDVLVLSPIESVWCQVGVGWANGLSAGAPELQQLQRSYEELFGWLAGSQVDFDYGDEEMIGRLARVEPEGASPAMFRVGKAPYRVVVVPKMTTIRSTTLKLLDHFRRQGGKVVFLGEPPAYVDAIASPAAAELAARSSRVAWNREALAAAVAPALQAPVEIVDADGKPLDAVFCQLRRDGDRRILVAMNMDRHRAFSGATIRVKAPGHVAEWDCRTGSRFAVASRTNGTWLEWSAEFSPVGEHVYVLTAKPDRSLRPKPEWKEVRREVLAGPFPYRLSEPNVCVLDLARWRLDAGAWNPETEVLKIDRAMRRATKLPIRGGEMVQPWFSKTREPKPTPHGKLVMAFDLDVRDLPPSPCELGIEQPENFRVTLNGKPLASTGARGWWVDPAIRTIPIAASLFVSGKNTLELATDFRQDVDIEAVYLLGRFGVQLDGTRKTLTRLPERLAPRDLAAQGLPFYSGAVTYRMAAPAAGGKRVLLETPTFEAACIKVAAGREKPEVIAWQPFRADITPLAAQASAAGSASASGAPTLDVEVVLTRRNTFGPLHLVPKKSDAYGPGHWVTEGANWSQEYQLYPAGLLSPPVAIFCEPK